MGDTRYIPTTVEFRAPKPETLNVADTMFLASGLYDDGLYEQALDLYRAADEAGGGFPAINGAGLCLNDLEQPESALKYFDRAYTILRDEMLALTSNRAKALTEMGRCEEALQMYNGLMASAPNDIFRYNRALTLMQMGQYEACISECNDILSRDASNDLARFARGFSYLVLGDYERGFKDYECRLKDELEPIDAELWTGDQDLFGKTILVHADQGYGDNIQFARFLPMLVERGARVIAVLPTSQKFLVNGVPGAEWRNGDRTTWPKLDYWVRFMSLAYCFRISRETVPPPVSLKLKEDAVALKAVLSELKAQWGTKPISVGLCWAGGVKSRYDKHRSLPLEQLAPLFELKDVAFYSLQKDLRESDRAAFECFPITDLSPALNTFEDTANVMAVLDLVITVDTSVAHLAGTVGVPTLVMLTAFRTYHLWIMGSGTSPWYPSVRLLKQKTSGEWGPVVMGAIEYIEQLKKRAA